MAIVVNPLTGMVEPRCGLITLMKNDAIAVHPLRGCCLTALRFGYWWWIYAIFVHPLWGCDNKYIFIHMVNPSGVRQ